MSDKTEKDLSKEKEEFLSACKEIRKALFSFKNELISSLWCITGTGQRQKKIKDEVAAEWQMVDKLFLSREEKKSLYEKYNECKLDKQKIEKWRSEFISINQRGPISQQPMRPPKDLTDVQTAAAILDYFKSEQFISHGYNPDKYTKLCNKYLTGSLKAEKFKPAPKKAISSSKAVKEAPKPKKKKSLPTIDLLKVAEDKLPWSKISNQIRIDDKGRVVSLPEDEEDIVTKIEELLKKDKPIGMAFDQCRQDRGNEQLVIKVNSSEQPDPEQNDIWFLGDIHGDLFGMTVALSYIDQVSVESGKKPIIIYLGDFFDRGEYGHWVLVKLFSQILGENRSRIGIVAGNHDVELGYARDRGFYSDVKPHEFADWLNEQSEDSVWPRLGRATIEFFKRMPRAIFMPDGLLIAHGGVPHTDLPVESFEQLNKPAYLQDFVWTRAHERALKRIPNRTTKGCSFGVKDLNQFFEQATKRALGDNPVRRMLRGHDHYLEGYKHFTKYVEYPLLTINTRCYQPDMMKGPYSDSLCVARWVKGKLPEVHMLSIPRNYLKQYYPNRNK